MEFNSLVEIVGDEPVFETSLLLAGDVDSKDIRRQLSRWVKAGKIYQLRRGLYTLVHPFQKKKPHPFVVANRMKHGSYVSLQSALSYYALIPEYVPVVTSVTVNRPRRWNTPLGIYDFRHIKTILFKGYRFTKLQDNQEAFIATPEKGLLDLIYLQPDGNSMEYLSELRLQNLEVLDLTELNKLIDLFNSVKLRRAFTVISDIIKADKEGYKKV